MTVPFTETVVLLVSSTESVSDVVLMVADTLFSISLVVEEIP